MRNLVAALGIATGTLVGGAALAEPYPVVVELFTSQGCSSCPPADAMVEDLAGRDDVIALAFHVDYWDYIGWVDTYGSPKNTARQHAYARAAGDSIVYTPQFIIGGVDHVIGARGNELSGAIADNRSADPQVSLSATMSDGDLRITAETTQPGLMSVQLIHYSERETVAITRGENAGETISYSNTVMDWAVLTEWDGSSPLELMAEVDSSYPGVVIVQQLGAGPILAAVRVP